MNDPRLRRASDPLRAAYSGDNIEIRLAAAADKQAALSIDDGYTTAAIWQMHDQNSSLGLGGMAVENLPGSDGAFGVVFMPVRLPRPRRADGLHAERTTDERLAAWAAGCMLVVGPRLERSAPDEFAIFRRDGQEDYSTPAPRQIWGYAVAGAVPTARLAWLAELVVAEEHRRHGLGTALLQATLAWARSPESMQGAGGMAALMVELSPRNSPAIAFCRARGFNFCGYTDYSSAGGDTKLLFSRSSG